MSDELKTTVINLKSLGQNIPDPVVVGAGDANGRTLRVIFTQEAAAQMTEDTKVYLSWHHQEVDIKGYNVFTHIIDEEDEDFPPTWEIKYPKSMLYEGNILACIQLVDHISIATSTNFMIHVLIDPNDGSRYTATDDFSEFQRAVINMTTLSAEMKRQMEQQKIEFEDMQLEFMDVRRIAEEARSASEQARDIAEQSLQVAQSALNTIVDLTDLAREARDAAQNAQERASQFDQEIDDIKDRLDDEENIVNAINNVANSALEIAHALEERCCNCVSKVEMDLAITDAKLEMSNLIQEMKDLLEHEITALDESLNDRIDDRIGSTVDEVIEEKMTDKIEQAKQEMIDQHIRDLNQALTIEEFV